ncbi:nuclear transport factor 2 family protein [Maricaulis sp.]|uniref:nuclear transport factor 2 family protein n=1 Tax=Maricaulis sp. TaxID=1486257 RepID=UPI003A94DD18
MSGIETVNGIIAAWKAGDNDALLEHLCEDVVYHFHVGSRPLRGRDAVRRFLERFGAGQTQIRWEIMHWAQAGDRLFVEGIDDYVAADGRRIRLPYAGVFEFRDGRVAGWRDYLDGAVVAAARAGEPNPEWVDEIMQST